LQLEAAKCQDCRSGLQLQGQNGQSLGLSKFVILISDMLLQRWLL